MVKYGSNLGMQSAWKNDSIINQIKLRQANSFDISIATVCIMHPFAAIAIQLFAHSLKWFLINHWLNKKISLYY